MPEDTVVYVFQDNQGKWLATVEEAEAQAFVTPNFHNQTIEPMALGELHRRDPHALVRARAQYYWASDLMAGSARGAVI